MMPIIDLQRRLREIGRVRMGDKTSTGAPHRLEAFRLTSADKDLLEDAADKYGGKVRPWKDNPGYFELYTTAAEIPFVIAPMEVSQWYESWSAGGCQRRCDGETEQISDRPCLCDPENRECKMTTRMSVMLPELHGLGVWRLESHGYYAAVEMPATADFLLAQAMQKNFIPAKLAIEQRTVKRDGKTKRFPVPVIRLPMQLGRILSAEFTGDKLIEEAKEAVAAIPPPPSLRGARGAFFASLAEHITEWPEEQRVAVMTDEENRYLIGCALSRPVNSRKELVDDDWKTCIDKLPKCLTKWQSQRWPEFAKAKDNPFYDPEPAASTDPSDAFSRTPEEEAAFAAANQRAEQEALAV